MPSVHPSQASSCARRHHHLCPDACGVTTRDLFLPTLEQVRRRYGFVVVGYVVMPDHHQAIEIAERQELHGDAATLTAQLARFQVLPVKGSPVRPQS